MKEVWFLFKLIEALLGLVCMIFHIEGFLDDRQPLPHHMYFCGTFFGFTLIAIFGIISISLGSKPSNSIEAIVSGVATVFFLTCSIFSMYHAERDFHLMYLSDYEEAMHPYFAISKMQSITSLYCGLLYLLHTIFAIDALIITEEKFDEEPSGSTAISKDDLECYQPIKLYVFGKAIHQILQRQRWFQKLMGESGNTEDPSKQLNAPAKYNRSSIINEIKYIRNNELI